MSYKVTEQVTSLVEKLISAGYDGEVRFTNCYCSGAHEVLAGSYSLELSGFCKETLCISEDIATGKLIFVGRYNQEYPDSEDVAGLVGLAYNTYKCYKERGYSMPEEFKELFKEYGHIKGKVVTKTVWEES